MHKTNMLYQNSSIFFHFFSAQTYIIHIQHIRKFRNLHFCSNRIIQISLDASFGSFFKLRWIELNG